MTTSDKIHYVNFGLFGVSASLARPSGASVSIGACIEAVGRGWRGFGGEAIPTLLVTVG